jgi:hypothetical protein
MTHPAEPERHDPHVGASNPNASSWDSEKPYLGPPEEGQPRAGSARPSGPGGSSFVNAEVPQTRLELCDTDDFGINWRGIYRDDYDATYGSPRYIGIGGVCLPRDGADDDEREARERERDRAEREEEERKAIDAVEHAAV